jgi:hypothetical protein
MEFCLDLEGFEKLLPGSIGRDQPVIDLRKCSFIQPEGALGVFLLLRYYICEGKRPRVLRPNDPDVDSYFERTGVPVMTFKEVEYVPDPSDVIMHSWTDRETMQAITPVVEQKEVGGIVEKFGLALKKYIQVKEVVNKLMSSMVETFQNMPEHANPKNPKDFEGYANIQSYPKGNRVVVAAGDLGIGIKKSLGTSPIYNRLSLTDMDAIERAVFQRATRYAGLRQASEHGGGIQRAVENLKMLRGITVIRSGCAALIIGPWGNPQRRTGLKYFPGTQVTFTIARC